MMIPFKDRKPDIEYLRMALNICELGVSYEQTDLIMRAYNLVKEKKGKTDINNAADIYYKWQNEWDEYYKQKKDK